MDAIDALYLTLIVDMTLTFIGEARRIALYLFIAGLATFYLAIQMTEDLLLISVFVGVIFIQFARGIQIYNKGDMS